MIGDRIKEKRIEIGITQAELAKRTGIKPNTISNYENNVSAPNEDNIFKLMEALECDANFLFEYTEQKTFAVSQREKNQIKKYRALDYYGKIAVDRILHTEYERCTAQEEEDDPGESLIEIKHSYYKVSAGLGFDLDEDDNWETISVPNTPEARKADFALTIKGDSMEPVYRSGDIVLVKQQDAVEAGEIGIFVVDGAGYIKKYGGNRLISLNAEYDDILFKNYDPDSIWCAGKVIGRV